VRASMLLAGCALALLSSPASASSGASRASTIPTCQASELAITSAGGSAGVGHVGIQFRVRNYSTQPCSLTGFPSVALLDSARRPLPTTLTWGPGYLAGQRPVRTVDLGVAYFVVEWVDMPAPGQSCPPAPYMLILLPATEAAPLVSLAPGTADACGGKLTVSPVEPTPFSGF
jgi:hypothetical protein